MRALRPALVASALLLSACAGWRWSGSPPPDGRSAKAALRGADDARDIAPAAPAAGGISVSTAPHADAPAAVPATPAERLKTAEFYSDLGPDTVDVSAYPAQQKYNYTVFARVCSSCHTLARAINAPIASRRWWEFYMLGMRARSSWRGMSMSRQDAKAVLDFLDYDARVRKRDHRRRFEQTTEALKKRFDAEVDARMRTLQREMPAVPQSR